VLKATYCLLHLTNGSALFSEPITQTEQGYVMRADKTLLLQIGEGANGTMTMNSAVMSNTPFSPVHLFVPFSAVLYAQDCEDPKALGQLRGALSNITVVSDVPPEFKGLRRVK
jgi:hypothetical protein